MNKSQNPSWRLIFRTLLIHYFMTEESPLLKHYTVVRNVTYQVYKIYFPCCLTCRPQWPRRLRHELSSLARALGLWVRIPFKAWIFVCVYSAFVLYVAALGAPRTVLDLRNWSDTKRFTDGSCSKMEATGKSKRERHVLHVDVWYQTSKQSEWVAVTLDSINLTKIDIHKK
jgi:hypothetical protein